MGCGQKPKLGEALVRPETGEGMAHLRTRGKDSRVPVRTGTK